MRDSALRQKFFIFHFKTFTHTPPPHQTVIFFATFFMSPAAGWAMSLPADDLCFEKFLAAVASELFVLWGKPEVGSQKR